MKNNKGTINWTYEDERNENPLGFENASFDLEIDYTYWPGEKMVMYYRDGSGYPGSPS